MKKADKETYNKDELGENVTHNKNIGLSTPEAEEGGDFVGKGKIKNTQSAPPDGKGSAGTMPYRMSVRKTDTGTIGSNAKKDRSTETLTGGEKDNKPGFRQDDVIL